MRNPTGFRATAEPTAPAAPGAPIRLAMVFVARGFPRSVARLHGFPIVSHASPPRSADRNDNPQIPRPVMARRQSPNGLGCTPYWIVRPAPSFFISPGVMAYTLTRRSCRRPEPDNPASYAASSTLDDSRSSLPAYSAVRNWRNRFGLMPAQRVNRRWKWYSLKPTVLATSLRFGCRRKFSPR